MTSRDHLKVGGAPAPVADYLRIRNKSVVTLASLGKSGEVENFSTEYREYSKLQEYI